MKKSIMTIFACFFLLLWSCKEDNAPNSSNTSSTFYTGADLSFVNEVEDCGSVHYKNKQGNPDDPFKILKDAGCGMVRVRLWHTPSSTYSGLEDVVKTLRRAKENGMKTLLDFHYSDTWADPTKQIVPAAWANVVGNTPVLADSMYNYTYKVLRYLYSLGLLPTMVQVGNEINPMILQPAPGQSVSVELTWARNATLLNSGIKAIRAVSAETKDTVGVMLHIAQPDDAMWWFDQATQAGVADYDYIGLSYYTKHSKYTFSSLGQTISSLISTYKKHVMIVETGYPFISNPWKLSEKMSDYDLTQEGQYDFLKDLVSTVKSAGGNGVIYWEPAWITTSCKSSAMDGSTLFDASGVPTLGMSYFALPK